MRRLLLTAALASLMVPIAPPAAAAPKTICDGALSKSVDGNVVVPTGATCTLDGTSVSGGLKVGKGATLAMNGASVDGAVKATRAAEVTIANSSIGLGLRAGGSFDIQESAIGEAVKLLRNPGTGAATFADNLVGEALVVKRNRAPVQVTGNIIGESLLIVRNKNGPITATDNTIGEDLVCLRNSPPAQASGNTVGRNDRCPQ